MATTSPDNLFSPNPSDNYNLIADWATSMQSVQSALVKRANMYVGTSTQRTAFTTAPEGTHWQDTNGTKLEYVRQSGVWARSGPRIMSGSFTLSVTANISSSQTITFPSGYFTEPPIINLTGGSGITPSTGLHMWVSGSPTTSSATISVSRGSNASQVVYWTATQSD